VQQLGAWCAYAAGGGSMSEMASHLLAAQPRLLTTAGCTAAM